MGETGSAPKSVIGHLREMSQIRVFPVEITETLQMTVMVRAASQEEAEGMVYDDYHAGKYVLGPEEFVDVAFQAREAALERAAPGKAPDL